jgi:hypothetical protein
MFVTFAPKIIPYSKFHIPYSIRQLADQTISKTQKTNSKRFWILEFGIWNLEFKVQG